MSPIETIAEGMLVCERCRKKANNSIDEDEDVDDDNGNSIIFISCIKFIHIEKLICFLIDLCFQKRKCK